jgi:hypothetical protein
MFTVDPSSEFVVKQAQSSALIPLNRLFLEKSTTFKARMMMFMSDTRGGLLFRTWYGWHFNRFARGKASGIIMFTVEA